MFSRFDTIQDCDRPTDRHTITENTVLTQRRAGKNGSRDPDHAHYWSS